MDNKMIDYVSDWYKELEKQQRNHKEQYDANLYQSLPQVEQIDNEIASLAINCANRVVKGELTVEEAFAQMEQRRDYLNAQKASLMQANGIKPFEPLPYKCSLCNDTGKIDGKQCKCCKKLVREYMIMSAKDISGFSCDIDKDNFGAVTMQYYSRDVIPRLGMSVFDYMSGIVGKCISYCNNFGADSDNLYFVGESGRGKTFLANCIANELLGNGVSVIYQSAYRLFQFLEDYKFGKLDREQSEKYYDAIYNCDFLIIDDLGTEYITAYTCSVFFDVLNTRLLNKKKTLISTNLNTGDLSNKYTDRIASRIIGDFSVFRFIGDDIRVKKKSNI